LRQPSRNRRARRRARALISASVRGSRIPSMTARCGSIAIMPRQGEACHWQQAEDCRKRAPYCPEFTDPRLASAALQIVVLALAFTPTHNPGQTHVAMEGVARVDRGSNRRASRRLALDRLRSSIVRRASLAEQYGALTALLADVFALYLPRLCRSQLTCNGYSASCDDCSHPTVYRPQRRSRRRL
jgi:hypothetical protein